MVSFYGAGEKTSAMNVESKLAKALGKEEGVLVVRASDRDLVLNEIDARIARYERFDPDTTRELKVLRANVRDIFNKGLTPGHDIVDQLYFLDPKTRDLVEKMSRHYDKVVTPDDFKKVAEIMSEHLAEEVPILQSFTKFFGRLAEDYLAHARPKDSAIDWKKIAAYSVRDEHKKGYVLPDWLSEALGVKAGEPVSAKFLKASGMYNPNSGLNDFLYGVKAPTRRTTGRKWTWLKIKGVNKGVSIEVMQPNKMPKRWTNIPWVNFDGKTLEQNFTQVFEERLVYTDPYGNRVTNILQVPQKTEATWWEQVINDEGNINDIADLNKARTAYGVNGNHSNDAVIVKKFHLWGRKHKVPTSTIHDAFFANAGNMLEARRALRQIYAESLDKNIIRETLLEMRRRGLPKHLYDQYLNEAIELGLIPVPGKSKIGGKVVREIDLLKREDILKPVPEQFDDDYGWYGVG